MEETTGPPEAVKIGTQNVGNETPEFRVDPEGELDYDELVESGDGEAPMQVRT